ncbi:MAG: hypothetical protein LBK47_06630 [Prevotellaceae bacterium]|jgi:hypothetical protein|nr:hypothetical protein [Prevotellaceae bacterium]
MKRVLLFLSLLAACPSCDREFDLFKEQNKVKIDLDLDADDITGGLQLTNGVLKDSIKRGQVRSYRMDIAGGSDNNTFTVDRLTSSNTVQFFLNDSLVINSVSIARGRNSVSAYGVAAGSARGSLIIRDVYERSVSVPYEFTVFNNLPPVCRISVIGIKELSPYEVFVDLSTSLDTDERFGGYVDQYEYRVGSYYRLTTQHSSIYHILPAAGTYDIRCRVRDNDGVWSEFVSRSITVTAE